MFGENNNNDRIVDKYLTWKWASDAWHFVYYDKEAGENKIYKLDEFILLSKWFKIMWWSDKHSKPIYSNQITAFSEELSVRAWDNNIVKWIYSEIKDDILSAWGKLHVCYTWLVNDEVIEIPLKWLSFFNSSEVLKQINTNENKIKLGEALAGKKWAVSFKSAVFVEWSKINDEEKEVALSVVQRIKAKAKAPVKESWVEAMEWDEAFKVEDIAF